jgi:predicted dehydrogenase
MHYRCWKALHGVTITALCDANPAAFTRSNMTTGNLGGASDEIDLASLKTFADFDEMLASGLTDVVSITLPTHLHKDCALKALAANQHVLCEKPMALSIADCDFMIAAEKSSKGLLQIGHCIRFWPEYVKTRDIIQSGQYGRVIAASFQRLSPMPSWDPSNWFTDATRSGGMPLDLHVHDADFIQHLFGMPVSVSCAADPELTHLITTYHYDHGPLVTAEASWRIARSHGFKMSFRITLEKATLVYDSTLTPTLRVYPFEGEPFSPEIPSGDGYSHEIEYFTKKIKDEPVETILTLQESRDTVRIVLAEMQSARQRETTFLTPGV